MIYNLHELFIFPEETSYLMVLKGSQVIDLSTDGSGRAGQLAPVVGIQGKFCCPKNNFGYRISKLEA